MTVRELGSAVLSGFRVKRSTCEVLGPVTFEASFSNVAKT